MRVNAINAQDRVLLLHEATDRMMIKRDRLDTASYVVRAIIKVLDRRIATNLLDLSSRIIRKIDEPVIRK